MREVVPVFGLSKRNESGMTLPIKTLVLALADLRALTNALIGTGSMVKSVHPKCCYQSQMSFRIKTIRIKGRR